MNRQNFNFAFFGFAAIAFFVALAPAQTPSIIWQTSYVLDRNYNSLKFTADNNQLIAGGERRLDSASGVLITRFNAADGNVLLETAPNYIYYGAREIAVSPDEQRIVTANLQTRCTAQIPPTCEGGYLQYGANDLERQAAPPDGNAANYSADYAPNGQLVALGGSFFNYAPIVEDNIRIVRADNLQIVRTLAGHSRGGNNSGTYSVRFSPDGTLLASGGFGPLVKIWRVSDGALLRSITFDDSYEIYSVAFSPDGQYVAASNGGYDPKVNVWRVSDGGLVRSFDVSSNYSATRSRVVWSRDGRYVVAGISYGVGSTANKIKFWNVQSGQLSIDYVTQADRFINDLTFSPNNQQFAWAASSQVFVAANPLAGASAKTLYDFDGDRRADVSVFRNGMWYMQESRGNFRAMQFGASADKIVPADYDGDGKTDVAVYQNGTWYLQRSQLGFVASSFGNGTDIPVPADYDADGKADIAVFRPSNGTWYLQRSQLGFAAVQFGQSDDQPVAADYDGDGKTDLCVFRPSNGYWYRLNSSNNSFNAYAFGQAGDVPVRGDFDNDGKADVAIFRPSTGGWYFQRSSRGFSGTQFGQSGDIPVPGDYDGDAVTDIAVFRPSNGAWYLLRSSSGLTGIAFGADGDIPIPALRYFNQKIKTPASKLF